MPKARKSRKHAAAVVAAAAPYTATEKHFDGQAVGIVLGRVVNPTEPAPPTRPIMTNYKDMYDLEVQKELAREYKPTQPAYQPATPTRPPSPSYTPASPTYGPNSPSYNLPRTPPPAPKVFEWCGIKFDEQEVMATFFANSDDYDPEDKTNPDRCRTVVNNLLKRGEAAAKKVGWEKVTHASVIVHGRVRSKYFVPVADLSVEDKAFFSIFPTINGSACTTNDEYLLGVWLRTRFELWSILGHRRIYDQDGPFVFSGTIVEIEYTVE